MSAVSQYIKPRDKILSLLYIVANTQSQPRIDQLANSFRFFYENEDSLISFNNFILKINPTNKPKINYDYLFKGMVKQQGWGNKTAALFVKIIFHMHNNDYSKELKIWEDAPNEINNNDSLYLPVDEVIKFIFNSLEPSVTWNFNNINRRIAEKYSGREIEVWDDLWFWGFITQKGSGKNRSLEWNNNKYWTLKESSKNELDIVEIEKKAKEFIKIVST